MTEFLLSAGLSLLHPVVHVINMLLHKMSPEKGHSPKLQQVISVGLQLANGGKITEGFLVLKEYHLVSFSLSVLFLPACSSVCYWDDFLQGTLSWGLSSAGPQCFQWQQ